MTAGAGFRDSQSSQRNTHATASRVRESALKPSQPGLPSARLPNQPRRPADGYFAGFSPIASEISSARAS